MLRSLCRKSHVSQAVAARFLGPVYFQRHETTVAKKEVDALSVEEEKARLQELLKLDFPKPYEGPERDLVNFPRRKRAYWPGKVRMGFLPDEWFQFFYNKTGVTGPYVFGVGLLTYLLSKEWYIIEHEFSTGVAIFILSYTAIKKFGPATKAYAAKLCKEELEGYEEAKQKLVDEVEDNLKETKKTYWMAEGGKILMEAKRENVQMQLETEYRRRLMNVYEQTKRRLDYNLELYNTKRKLEQTHMVDWIVNSVVKSITPEQEKEALKKCIEDLNVLSAKAV